VTKCKNLVHAVFDHFPHGDRYAMVSRYLSDKFDNNLQAVPHMINLPKHNENMRQELNIPNDAFVFGRYGGEYQFDITIAHNAIKQILETDLNMYFIFANTRVFYVHPRIIYLQAIVDLRKKVKFINTCDAMIHARSDGETYGLSIGEFSSCNKPVVTTYSREFNAHIEILKDNAIIYNNEPELVDIFTNIREIVKTRTDWNAFKDYAPEKVMAKFMEVFVEEPKTVSSSTDVVLITAFLDIGRGGWNEYERHASKYINAFMKYLNYDYQMIVFIDERYAEEILQAYEKSRFKNKRFIAINESWMKQNIYAWRQYEKDNAIMQSESYKIMVKHRIERNYPENVYSKYNLINHSKIDFIHYAISQNLICDDAVVCWSDFGYFSAILHNNPMEYPVTTLDFNKFNQDRITISTRNHIDEMDKNIFYTLTRAPEKISGAFFGGPARMMSEFQKLYHECLNELYDNNVSDDDQHVYLRCIFRSPKLFEVHLLGDDWGKILVHFQKQKFDYDPCVATPLCEIMGRNKSDKGDIDIKNCWHNYTTFYYSVFKDMRDRSLRVFELGLGTNNPNLPSSMGINGRPGASLYGWSEFFKNARIYGADIDKNILFKTDIIDTFYCDQTDPDVIKTMWESPELSEPFDIIVEDGLHEFNANVCFFENSIHKLASGGYYIIEDVVHDELPLFKEKMAEWSKKYVDLTFDLVQLHSTRNKWDNNLIVVKKHEESRSALFLITSCVNVPAGSSIYDSEQRYEQTLNTIKTIKDHVPNAIIVVVECSIGDKQYQFEGVTMFYIKFQDISDKSTTEARIIKMFLQSDFYTRLTKNVDIVFKISGRYFLNEKFNISNYSLKIPTARLIDTKNEPNYPNYVESVDPMFAINPDLCCVTCLFSFPPIKSAFMIERMNRVIDVISTQNHTNATNIEQQIFKDCDTESISYINVLGVSGHQTSGFFVKY
jgi:hypothetical protein